ncbi:MAG: 2-amino-4-hydroxy-6-hydroxymethyldihydropteridine diphosphokinase [Betaproteobacteria bacterium RIFCSPLOWO2_02_FULL_64_12]|nr:MAG: 2-amino-4-hydroxy-6-hydroxymethyldihydropteridine diphosphokinase [Betaproteobacteria bacterium RIFCSPLOWO2_02_FULL_64_12]
MPIAYVGIGANLGEAETQVKNALTLLARLESMRLVRASSLYRTAPLGFLEQPDFVNAVAEIDTALSPGELLAKLREIESGFGRTRGLPNAPRTLDLDLLLYGAEVIEEPGLTVPHRRMHERAFVLAPLVEIAPGTSIPGKGRALDLLERCRGQKVERLPRA